MSMATEPAGRRARPPDRRSARLGDRPLQLPLPVLHARRGPALARARGDPHLRGDRPDRSVFAAMGVRDVRLTGGEPLVRREFPRLVAMLGDRRRQGAVAHDQRLPARARRRGARRGRDRSLQRVGRLAAARPLLRADPARRPRPGARGLELLASFPAGAPDQGQRGRDRAGSPRRRCSAVRRAGAPTRLRGAVHRVHAARRRPGVDA